MDKNSYCVIMAGGIGSRFWPLSRNSKPKQFIDILGTGKSFIRMTFDRFAKFIPIDNFLVVTSEIYKDLVLEHIPELSVDQILCEPLRRNTAPCIAYATYKLYTINKDANIIVTPSDHMITNEDKFCEVMKNGLKYASKNNSLVTVGITPSRPETGYGYIQVSGPEACKYEICKVKTFTEKPDIETAKMFLNSGEFFWNSGIFVWNINSIKEALEEFLPEVADMFSKGMNLYNTDKEMEFISETYSICPNISIDYGVMEKADNVFVYNASFGWSDIGTWNSLYYYTKHDQDNNIVNSDKIFIKEVNGSLINTTNSKKLIVTQGLEDFLIVDTDDVLMICPRSDENIKSLVSEAIAQKGDEYA